MMRSIGEAPHKAGAPPRRTQGGRNVIEYRRWLGIVCLGLMLAEGAARSVAAADLTESERAENGPLPGDIGLYASELRCQNALPTPGYYSSLNGAEIADSQRSGTLPLR